MFLYLRFFWIHNHNIKFYYDILKQNLFLLVLFIPSLAPLLTPLELSTHPKLVFYFHVPRVLSTSSPLGTPSLVS